MRVVFLLLLLFHILVIKRGFSLNTAGVSAAVLEFPVGFNHFLAFSRSLSVSFGLPRSYSS